MRSATLLPPALLVLLLPALACDTGDAGEETRASAPPGLVAGTAGAEAGAPEAISLLGERLHALPSDSAAAARFQADVDSARARHEANRDDPDALVWLGRRLAYAGRYRDAIDAFTEGIGQFPDDARFYRHRGHRYITVRELDRAVADLDHADGLTAGEEDVVEPDGMPNDAGVPRSTLQTNIVYHLALARYLQGDFDGAARDFARGLDISPNDDMRVAMADWLWMALMRLGRDDEAAAAIAFVEPEMEILENDAYHRRLLLYRGLIPPDSLAQGLGTDEGGSESPDPEARNPNPETRTNPDPLQIATYGYGLGHWHLLRDDRDRARRVFEDVLDTGYWPAFGFIAAEAELARWEDPGAGAADPD